MDGVRMTDRIKKGMEIWKIKIKKQKRRTRPKGANKER